MILATTMEELAQQFMEHAPYIGVFIVLMLTGMGLPLPEDIPLLISGYLCHAGVAHLWLMIPLALVAVVGSDSGLFWMGRRWGHHVTRVPMLKYVLSESSLQRAERAFHRHGGKTLFVMRFVPGVRAAAFFTAGAFKLPFWKLLVFDGLAALISVPAWILLGWYLGEDIDKARAWGRDATGVALGLIILAIAAYAAFHYWRKRRATPARHVLQPSRTKHDNVAG